MKINKILSLCCLITPPLVGSLIPQVASCAKHNPVTPDPEVKLDNLMKANVEEDCTLTIAKNMGEKRNVNLQVTTDEGKTWVSASDPYTYIPLKKGTNIYFYGKNPEGWKHAIDSNFHIVFAPQDKQMDHGFVNLSGSIMSLFGDVEKKMTKIPGYTRLSELFICKEDGPAYQDESYIKTVSEDFLPATELTDRCYDSLFAGNKYLTTLPKLPATKLTTGCYKQMYQDCKSIVSVPKNYLPSTIAVNSCYEGMFCGCDKLQDAPDLPATQISVNCYYEMFKDCVSLINPPSTLPATKVIDQAYQSMFEGCSSLKTLPVDFSKIDLIGENCFTFMFKGTAIDNIDNVVFPKAIAEGCYWGMFEGTKIKKIPENLLPYNPEEDLAEACYGEMFKDCKELETIPGNLLPSKKLAKKCYDHMFEGCTGLTSIPVGLLPAEELAPECYSGMFDGCENIEAVPDGLLNAKEMEVGCYDAMFAACHKLKKVPKDILSKATKLANGCFESMFYQTAIEEPLALPTTDEKYIPQFAYAHTFAECPNLVIPENYKIPQTSFSTRCCDGMFSKCPKITIAPKMGIANIDENAECPFFNMFFGCASLKDISNIKITVRDTSTTAELFYNMFAYCPSITEIPEKFLSSIELVGRTAYQSMFAFDTGLKTVPANLFVDDSKTDYEYQYHFGTFIGMFENCTSLDDASKIKLSTLNVLDANTGAYYVPISICSAMFKGCRSLKKGPDITLWGEDALKDQKRELDPSCFADMFSDCISLTETPKFVGLTKTTKVDKEAFAFAFKGCTSLNKISSEDDDAAFILPLNGSVCDSAYESMFEDCTSLKYINGNESVTKNVPLFGSTTTSEMYPARNVANSMFKGCTELVGNSFKKDGDVETVNLIEIPNLQFVEDNDALAHMFENCSKLKGLDVKFNTFARNTGFHVCNDWLKEAGTDSATMPVMVCSADLITEIMIDGPSESSCPFPRWRLEVR